MNPPQPDRSTMRERIAALPLVEGGEVLTHTTSLGALDDLSKQLPEIEDHLDQGVTAMFDEVRAELPVKGKHYLLTEDQLYGFARRFAIYGVAQLASDVGQAEVNLRGFRELLGVEIVEIASDVDEPPAA